jgi:hypothetical protein
MGMTMLSRISLGCAALLALVATGCDKVPLTAPTGSSVFISTASTFVPTGGTTQVTAFVSESGGTQVQNGTMVHFSTNLGRMDPVDAQTTNGYAVSTFIAGDASGVAEVRANSGGIGGSTSGDTATNSNMVQITVGAAAVESVTLSANPASVPAGGGTVELLATVAAASEPAGIRGRSLQGILVTFAASEGQLASSTAVTDANGQARTTLTTDRTATVTASAAGKTSNEVTVTRRDPPGVASATLAGTPGTPVVGFGQTFTFTATLTVAPPDAAIQATRYEWTFGDGSGATTNGNTISHVYTSGANSPRTATVTITLTNGQTAVASTDILLGAF